MLGWNWTSRHFHGAKIFRRLRTVPGPQIMKGEARLVQGIRHWSDDCGRCRTVTMQQNLCQDRN